MIKRATCFRVNPRNYPRFSASMSVMIFRVTVLLAVFLLIPIVAQAALLPTPTGSCPSTAPDCVLGKCTVGGAAAPGYELPCNYTLDDILQSGVNFINLILGIVGGLALLIFVYGGFRMLISAGNQEAVNKAKSILTGGLIGLIIILGAATIVNLTGNLLVGEFEPKKGIVAPSGEISPGVTPEEEQAIKKAEEALAIGCCLPIEVDEKCKPMPDTGKCPVGFYTTAGPCTDYPQCNPQQ